MPLFGIYLDVTFGLFKSVAFKTLLNDEGLPSRRQEKAGKAIEIRDACDQ